MFRTGLFSALIEVAASGLCTCKDFEVTNLLWACGQLCKHFARVNRSRNSATRWCVPVQVAQRLHVLMNAVEVYFQDRLHEVTSPILVSALVSIATLASLENVENMSELFRDICKALALRNEELSFNNKTQVGVAGKIMSKHNRQCVQAVSMSICTTCPELAAYLMV